MKASEVLARARALLLGKPAKKAATVEKEVIVAGSRSALFELFSRPTYLPVHAHFKGTRKERRIARQKRLDNWSRALHAGFNAKRLERFTGRRTP